MFLAMLDLNSLVIRFLAVAGGAAVGYLVIGGLLRFVGRFFLRDKVPRFFHVAARLLGALTGAVLIWLWLFAAGGSGGWGSGGGWLPFGGSGSGSGKEAKTSEPERKTTDPAAKLRSEVVQVELLGGENVKDQRFYQLEGVALSFGDVTKAIEKRRQDNPNLKVLRLVVHKESVDPDNPAVTQLQRWARENGMTPELATP